MKNPIHIGGALFVGTFIVLGALYVRDHVASNTGGEIVVLPAPERSYIESKDSDGDGIKDWEEDIQNQFGFSDTATVDLSQTATYTPPTTLTGKFSEAFLKDYLTQKMIGQDMSDPTQFVASAVQAIDANTVAKKHSRLELTIVDSSPEVIHEYGNKINEIIQKHSVQSENEAVILQQALTLKDPTLLVALDPIHTAYTRMLADSLTMKVPDDLVDEHLALINSYEGIIADITAMRAGFDDPLLALARIRVYEKDVTDLYTAISNLAKEITAVTEYRNDEPGAYFYKFTI